MSSPLYCTKSIYSFIPNRSFYLKRATLVFRVCMFNRFNSGEILISEFIELEILNISRIVTSQLCTTSSTTKLHKTGADSDASAPCVAVLIHTSEVEK